MKRITALLFISFSLFACTTAKQTLQGAQQLPADTKNYVGSWESIHANSPIRGVILLNSDGTFESTCYVKKKLISEVTGKWFIRDNTFVWIYNRDQGNLKKGEEDVNPIVKYEKDKLILREMSGSLTTFIRKK